MWVYNCIFCQDIQDSRRPRAVQGTQKNDLEENACRITVSIKPANRDLKYFVFHRDLCSLSVLYTAKIYLENPEYSETSLVSFLVL